MHFLRHIIADGFGIIVIFVVAILLVPFLLLLILGMALHRASSSPVGDVLIWAVAIFLFIRWRNKRHANEYAEQPDDQSAIGR